MQRMVSNLVWCSYKPARPLWRSVWRRPLNPPCAWPGAPALDLSQKAERPHQWSLQTHRFTHVCCSSAWDKKKKNQKQAECPLTEEQFSNLWFINSINYSHHKKERRQKTPWHIQGKRPCSEQYFLSATTNARKGKKEYRHNCLFMQKRPLKWNKSN